MRDTGLEPVSKIRTNERNKIRDRNKDRVEASKRDRILSTAGDGIRATDRDTLIHHVACPGTRIRFSISNRG